MFPIHLGELAQVAIAATVLVNCYQSWRVAHSAKKISEGVAEIKAATNGLSDKLLEVTAKAKFAEGVKHSEDYIKRSAETTEE